MDSGQQKSRPILAILIFVAAIGAIAFVFATFPPFTAEQKQRLRLPSNIEDVKIIGEIMAEYKDKYYFTVLLGFSLVYLFLQTFTIPGTIFLNFLAGALFGIYVTVPLCCFLAATGASGAFMMSHLIGRRIVMKFAPDRLRYFNEQIQKHRQNLFNYFLFLRISPLLPNWFVNLASPICSVPFKTFWIGTFFGVMPQTFIVVRAGLTLQDIKSPSDVLDIRAFITLALLAFLALIPTLKPVQNVLDRLLTRTDNKNKHH